MSYQDRGRFISQWEAGINPLSQFEQSFEGTRKVFHKPLSAIYQALFQKELARGDILALGIGTGQVEEMARVDSRRIRAIDVSIGFLNKARTKLPKAHFHQGRIQDVLPSLDHHSLAFSSDALDCINPLELGEVLSLIRKKTDKLVIAQVFMPDDEFYSFYFPRPGIGSHGGPGIDGWNQDQHTAAEQHLNNLRIISPINQPDSLLKEVQAAVHSKFNSEIKGDMVDLLDSIGFQFRTMPQIRNHRAYASEVDLFLEYIADYIGKMRENVLPRRPQPQEVAKYVAVHTIHRLSQLFHGTIQMELFFKTFEDACLKAGFTNIQRKALAASGDRIVNDPKIIENVNRSLLASTQLEIPASHIDHINSGSFTNGAAMTFFEPQSNPFNDARVQYLVAS
ncbi:class I SAM-dependent methyltransferase [Candidatus Roizmanbacteria bacterium]|nr:class I SAM-dependent methyltransferase [Candidatus Roizmanbacteria bacterium]